jgi:PST family polysaccharide transporter
LSIAARGINILVQVGSVILLARLLSPEDYGLVAMVTAITGFAPVLVDLGTRDALVQRDRITQAEVSALFWTTMLVGSIFALVIAASGPLISRFYHEPRLTMITLVSSLTFITSALTCQHHALLRRAMMFRELALVEICANVLSAILAIALAVYGFAYWALVLRPIASTLLLSIGVWSRARWLPGKPEITQGVKDMLRFGIHLTGFCLADFVGRCADRVAIGYTQGARSLGFYQKATLVYDNMLELTIALHSVAVVSLSKLRDNLPELRRLWSKGLGTLSFF